VREFVEGETRGNLRHSPHKLTEEQYHLALAGYNLMVAQGIKAGVWPSEPTGLKIKAVYELPITTGNAADPAKWKVIEP
jgi:hypothetical protein